MLIRAISWALLLGLCASPAVSQARPENRPKGSEARSDTALEGLVERLQACLAARAEGSGVDEARAALASALAAPPSEAGEAGKGAGDARAQSEPLADVATLGRALWLALDGAREPAGTRAGKVTEDELREGAFRKSPLAFAYRLPRAYREDRAWPLLLTVPDAGETPADHLRTHWSFAPLEDEVIVVVPAMPAEQSEWTRVSVSGRPGGLCHVLTVLRAVSSRFAVDFDRVTLAGRGKSAPAALAAGDAFPQRFAAVLCRGGDAGDLSPQNLVNVPVLFVGGGAKARAFVEAARTLSIDGVELRPTSSEAELWDWIHTHPRRTWPERVVVAPGDPFPTRCHWLRIAPNAPDARVEARLERDANTVRIDGHGFSSLTLQLSDALLDLSYPVRVIVNGNETNLDASRSAGTLLDLLADGTADPAAPYTAELAVDVQHWKSADDLKKERARAGVFEAAWTRAGDDAEALWALQGTCERDGQPRERERVLRKIVRLEPDHAEARTALGQVSLRVQWFPSAEAQQRYAAGQDDAIATERGYVRFKGTWIPPADRANAGKGWTKDAFTGMWIDPGDAKRIAAGWVRQDLEWVAPADVANVDRGLWRVEGEWVPLDVANRRRARVDSMWHVPGPNVWVHATADRAVALRAAAEMERAIGDLRRVFGAEPALPLDVCVLRDEEQYDRCAFGDPDGARLATHAGRQHAVHSAFFAESWFERRGGKPVFRGMGVCYWDPSIEGGDLYGVHSARLAGGLSYVDALDPSSKAVKRALAGGPPPSYWDDYQSEKQLPAWLRTGGAVYAERYFRDDRVAAGGNPWWAREWSLDNLRAKGGLRPLADVLAFRLDPDDRADGQKLMIEAGLLVSFALDGECAPVRAAHAELVRALIAGRSPGKAAAALGEAITANEDALRAWAGL